MAAANGTSLIRGRNALMGLVSWLWLKGDAKRG
jgi:hypothetical protein